MIGCLMCMVEVRCMLKFRTVKALGGAFKETEWGLLSADILTMSIDCGGIFLSSYIMTLLVVTNRCTFLTSSSHLTLWCDRLFQSACERDLWNIWHFSLLWCEFEIKEIREWTPPPYHHHHHLQGNMLHIAQGSPWAQGLSDTPVMYDPALRSEQCVTLRHGILK